MGRSRTVVFVGSFVVSAALLILFATGFFNKASSPQEVLRPASHMVVADGDSGDGSGSGDDGTDQGTELQDPEQQEQQSEQGPGRFL
jgi:hypothetical protein